MHNHLHFTQDLKNSQLLNNVALGIVMDANISNLSDTITIEFRYEEQVKQTMNQDEPSMMANLK